MKYTKNERHKTLEFYLIYLYVTYKLITYILRKAYNQQSAVWQLLSIVVDECYMQPFQACESLCRSGLSGFWSDLLIFCYISAVIILGFLLHLPLIQRSSTLTNNIFSIDSTLCRLCFNIIDTLNKLSIVINH